MKIKKITKLLLLNYLLATAQAEATEIVPYGSENPAEFQYQGYQNQPPLDPADTQVYKEKPKEPVRRYRTVYTSQDGGDDFDDGVRRPVSSNKQSALPKSQQPESRFYTILAGIGKFLAWPFVNIAKCFLSKETEPAPAKYFSETTDMCLRRDDPECKNMERFSMNNLPSPSLDSNFSETRDMYLDCRNLEYRNYRPSMDNLPNSEPKYVPIEFIDPTF